MNERIVKIGFIVAGLANIVGIFVVTHGMTSDTIAKADPAVFSQFGVLMIMLWGMAYIATSRYAAASVLIPLTFALEKLAYTVNWALWMGDNASLVDQIREQDLLGGIFMGGYGINDGLFCLFFLAVAISNWRKA